MTTSPSTPTYLGGRYRKVSELGDGQQRYAQVFKALDLQEGDAPVAVKVLALDGPDPSITWSMFQKELTALDGFTHPAVVALLGSYHDTERGQAGIILELVEGGLTLENHVQEAGRDLSRRKPLSWRVVQLLRILDALTSVHQRRVLHRDVKLRNVLYDERNAVLKLADFGVARLITQYGEGLRTLDDHFSLPYAAPEQRDFEMLTEATDLYAFGLVAAALLTYQLPDRDFSRRDLDSFLEPLRQQGPTEAGYAQFLAVWDRLLSRRPEERPHVSEVEQALKSLLDEVLERPETQVRLEGESRKYIERTFGVPEFLEKLNDGLRARGEQVDGDRALTVWLYGREVWLRTREDGDRLVVERAGRLHGGKLLDDRERAFPMPFRVRFSASGDAYELRNAVFDRMLVELERETDRQNRIAHLQLAADMLELKEGRLKDLWMECQWDKGSRSGGGAIKPAGGMFVVAPGDRATLRIHAASGQPPVAGCVPLGEDTEATLATFVETLEEEPSALYEDNVIGQVVGISAEQHEVTVQFSRAVQLPQDHLVLLCRNVAAERALRRQQDALEAFVEGATTNPRLPELLLKPRNNRVRDALPPPLLQPGLRPPQQVGRLVAHALSARDFYAVQGPPGTGKTTTITEVVLQILEAQPDARILLTSQNNDAVDNALEKTQEIAGDLGKPLRLLREVSEFRGRRNPLGFDETFRSWVRVTRDNSREATRGELGLLTPMAAEQEAGVRATLAHWQDQLDKANDVRQDFLLNVQVFGVTCLRLPALYRRYPHLQDLNFDWVIVDEAARAHHSELLVALVRGRRFVLVGDQRQLPPHVHREDLGDLLDKGYTEEEVRRSLFEELFDALPTNNRARLDLQFRMHSSIARLVSSLYYEPDGVTLLSDVPEAGVALPFPAFDKPNRTFWIDVDGQEQRQPPSTSAKNFREARTIRQLLDLFEKQAQEHHADPRFTWPFKVAVITPYVLQKELLDQHITPKAKEHWQHLDIQIDTVDAFQGKQADVVFFSVVSTEGYRNEFVGDPHRLNVAFSRARRLLLIVGQKARALRDPELARALQAVPASNHVPPGGAS
ncbi:serine/threonine-protein kinase [Deinococcus budaensis]|uniref:Protein kinase domain-containing protein n=1 Tax=Deinococcus budaensis TaxID=1665626 RepID=A0A7W8GEF0_9DEIO|nr:serine/threonine-protein kinase [Deinococcus budaensis]MBB5234122.1 hypothetical protein [Deinococcus budaensis]